MDYYSTFPFYMGYQGYGQWAQPGIVQEDRILEDLEYLQQMYPTYARKYQNTISSIVDKMDYEGSFIYDQYPDKISLQRMVESVMAVIRTNEETQVPAEKTPGAMLMPQAKPDSFVPDVSMPMPPAKPEGSVPGVPMPMPPAKSDSFVPGVPISMPQAKPDSPASDVLTHNNTSGAMGISVTDRSMTEQAPWCEKEPWIRELVTVLMYYEILTRRRKKKNRNQYYQF